MQHIVGIVIALTEKVCETFDTVRIAERTYADIHGSGSLTPKTKRNSESRAQRTDARRERKTSSNKRRKSKSHFWRKEDRKSSRDFKKEKNCRNHGKDFLPIQTSVRKRGKRDLPCRCRGRLWGELRGRLGGRSDGRICCPYGAWRSRPLCFPRSWLLLVVLQSNGA